MEYRIMKSRKVALAALLCFALIGSAGATTKVTNLGTLENGDFGIVSNAFLLPQSFQDTINFTLTSNSTISGIVVPWRLICASWSLSSTMGEIASGALAFGRYTFADLAPGSYSVSIFGKSRALGGYAASYKVAVAAVPEIETWLMLLIGVGLAAYQLHRKQKTLGLQVLRDDSMRSA
jgi:hypothetical protein